MSIRSLIVALATLSALPAHAACSSMNAATFEKFVLDASAAIDDDDLVKHGQVFRALQEQLPCMDEGVPVGAWADFLVGYSVVEYAMGREWESPLDVALTIKPTVARDFGPVEIRNYVPTIQFVPDGAPALPADTEVYLDGVRILAEPKLGRMHIVQQLKAGVWNTRLLTNEPFPEDWRVQFVEEQPSNTGGGGATVFGVVYGLGGFALGGQVLTSGAADEDLIEESGGNALVGVGSHGRYGPAGPIGMFWDVSTPTRLDHGPGVEGFVGPALLLGPLHVQLGGGAVSVRVTDGDGPDTIVLPQPHLSAGLQQDFGDSLGLELGAGGGASPSGWHGKARWGLYGGEGLTWSAGLELSTVTGLFRETTGTRQVTASAWRGGLRGGIQFD